MSEECTGVIEEETLEEVGDELRHQLEEFQGKNNLSATPAVSTPAMQVRSKPAPEETGCDTDAVVTHHDPTANVSHEARCCLELEALQIEVECGVITMQEYEHKKTTLLGHAAQCES